MIFEHGRCARVRGWYDRRAWRGKSRLTTAQLCPHIVACRLYSCARVQRHLMRAHVTWHLVGAHSLFFRLHVKLNPGIAHQAVHSMYISIFYFSTSCLRCTRYNMTFRTCFQRVLLIFDVDVSRYWFWWIRGYVWRSEKNMLQSFFLPDPYKK